MLFDEKYLASEATCQVPTKYFKSCAVCGEKGSETFENGDKNPDKHGDNTEIKDDVAATCTANGYTGDTYCKDCGAKVKTGKAIPAAHKGGKATCVKKAKCEVCGEEYGELDPDNHGETELRDAVEATESDEGYTGEKYYFIVIGNLTINLLCNWTIILVRYCHFLNPSICERSILCRLVTARTAVSFLRFLF